MMKRGASDGIPMLHKKAKFGEKTSLDSENLSVKVFVRIRPFNERETECSCRRIVIATDETSVLFDPEEEAEPFFFKGTIQKGRDITKRPNKNLHFEFDKVYDENATNSDVFKGTTKNIISSILDGYNCSVFAYGATGAGKTFTMLGTEQQPGIAYLTIVELLECIRRYPNTKVTLGASYLEVYNENVKDLLFPGGSVLQLREDGPGGRVTVSGLKVKQINHADELFALLTEGNRNRTQHPTDSNEESSRSHAVFQVHARVVSDGFVKISKLSMIDLAGSERAAATGCKGERFKEGANINKSLLALGNCINAIADGLKHIPYRDSKLTRILKDSLGGNCRTVMIANISPSSSSYEDTYNTLKYATRTRCIKMTICRNIINESMTIPQYKKIVQDLEKKLSNFQDVTMNEICSWKSRIEDLFEERKKICREILNLQSQAKITDWRIQQKEQAISHHDTTANIGFSERLGSSIYQLKARCKSIQGRLNEIWPDQDEIKKKISKLEEDIAAEKKLSPVLKDILEKNKLVVEVEEQKIRLSHSDKIIKLISRNEATLNATLNQAFPLVKEQFAVLRGHGYVTEEQIAKYEEAVRRLDGDKGISWCGDEDEDVDDAWDIGHLRLNSIDENQAVLRNKTLTTTIILPSTFPLRQNNNLGNIVKNSPKPLRWGVKGRVGSCSQRTAVANKENIKKVGTATPITRVKSAVRPMFRPHPYQRTPLKPAPSNGNFKTKVKPFVK